eukprot:CAMPEP_0202716044 /NCGR_PEP_ID=MMETSP1385-20130828/96656_1 /ASSEMBLY_ACC=CAM_ASM_000861 /TAXON_ID=933848 /ORGANISM="Elphidium margaritaceum" /LENGTH=50 /DNA_ID=CAMNT_0049377585 /DNA_START=19 /DNA_END=167 /DNA_ORIENTATION=+
MNSKSTKLLSGKTKSKSKANGWTSDDESVRPSPYSRSRTDHTTARSKSPA